MRLVDGQLKLQGLPVADSDSINIQCLNAFSNCKLLQCFNVVQPWNEYNQNLMLWLID